MLTFVGDYLPNSAFVAPPSLRGDAIIANIEAAIAPRASGANRKAHSIMLDAESFRYIETSGAAALSVANNHAYDAGPDAFDRMIARLRRRSVPIYGLQDAPFCDIRHDGFRVLIIGCLEPCRARGARLFRQEGRDRPDSTAEALSRPSICNSSLGQGGGNSPAIRARASYVLRGSGSLRGQMECLATTLTPSTGTRLSTASPPTTRLETTNSITKRVASTRWRRGDLPSE